MRVRVKSIRNSSKEFCDRIRQFDKMSMQQKRLLDAEILMNIHPNGPNDNLIIDTALGVEKEVVNTGGFYITYGTSMSGPNSMVDVKPIYQACMEGGFIILRDWIVGHLDNDEERLVFKQIDEQYAESILDRAIRSWKVGLDFPIRVENNVFSMWSLAIASGRFLLDINLERSRTIYNFISQNNAAPDLLSELQTRYPGLVQNNNRPRFGM